ncbi:hypothetical protein C361_02255 [Cryptococcus neoformans Tu259-1]|uniref:Uncharacterized protein n=1 Tax=Cryptococcus neoformans Tu259-1 TaxID=1230072 RepID=A0A854QHA5_CRYNE|nr:hypothetical protein C361_02255 [Cryptococcus neoformans var. grubii Tu259-1]
MVADQGTQSTKRRKRHLGQAAW